ncbi:MAG: BamA/TamA family outer membrane protein [Ignavibacteriales bacterium]|nr:BamA/TamA family outer membrane protein [Ignavibacteriales bacterium]
MFKIKCTFENASNTIAVYLLLLIFAGFGFAQTMDDPIVISLEPISTEINSGQHSALILSLMVPRGYWLGSNERSSRNPSATIVEIEPLDHFTFGQPQFPEPIASGVPVHKGYTYIFDGKVNVIIPFSTDENLENGEYKIAVKLTYTPGLNAGQLITHIDEEHFTIVKVISTKKINQVELPAPSITQVPEDFLVREVITELPQPLKTMLHRWEEDTPIPDFFHWMWVDPENHGKHIQTVFAPFVGNTENNGKTIGGSVALLNLTPEGIMTGLFQIRAYWNENFGSNIAFEAVSCPAAYFNYWFSSELSTNGENQQLHFHIENLTLGERDLFGYELQLDVFKDPRFRFYGISSGTVEEDKTVYSHSQSGATLDFYWMPVDHLRLSIGGKYKSVAVNDGAEKLRGDVIFTTSETSVGGKFFEVPGIKGATVAGERLNIVYDTRNSEFLPTDGFYAKLTGEFDQIAHQVITTSENINQYGKFIADFRTYFSTIDQRFTFLIRNSWTLTTSKFIPFFEQASLGGDFSSRGFADGRFFDQHSVFLSMEFRYQAMHINLMGTPWTIEMAPFLDMGQVFNSEVFDGVFNVSPGMSFRMLNKPNVGMVGNIAYSQDGIVLTGGVQLPF